MKSSHFLSFLRRIRRGSDWQDEQPIRAEIFSVERLEQYAQTLATEHRIIRTKGRPQLLSRLKDNSRKLNVAYRSLVEVLRSHRAVPPAGEWLVDNFPLVEEQLRAIYKDLPQSFYEELPKLADGELKGYPRIYAVALSLIAHTDCQLDTATLRRYVAAYQGVAPFSIGEIWAVASALRLVLIENLRRLAVQVVREREERAQADRLADVLLERASRHPAALVPLTAERLNRRDKIPQSFVVQLTQRLREQDPAVMVVMEWIEKQLARVGTSIEQIIQVQHQRQAATQVTVGNIITSMRLLATVDWQDFFESVSLADPVLAKDPANIYQGMEFATRDRYRHVIEKISSRTGFPELEVAQATIEMARKAAAENPPGRPETHVGYYLLDAGRSELESRFFYRPAPGETLLRYCQRHPTGVYLGSLAILTLSLIALLLIGLSILGSGWQLLICAAIITIIPAVDLAVTISSSAITRLLKPRLLQRMDTTRGIPEEARTMVVVPVVFSNEAHVSELLGKIEIHFLGNQDQHIYFALLADFPDADSQEMPGDSALFRAATEGIAELNRRHSDGAPDRFYVFHRRRQWNESQHSWLGWERKRGKLHEFNRLLRGAVDTSFIEQVSDRALFGGVRYVITLDADTQLPRDVARRLVGTAFHPLNRPRLDPAVNRVVYGYGLLQPRVSISLGSSSRSEFARIISGNTGIDPYTTAASDLYQDLFCEGDFTGKGLYDVDAFMAALGNRVPESSLLSHDLFESLFARAALVSDLELLEEYPGSYITYTNRQHRWTRGDWQLLPWLFPKIPDQNRPSIHNSLPLFARWRIFDNARRNLVAPALFLWLLVAWTAFPSSPWLWSLLVVTTIAFPVYLRATTSLFIHPRGIPWTSYFWTVWGTLRTNSAQVVLAIIFLPHQAYLMTDAIVRTVYRKLISHKKLLSWVTAADTEKAARHNIAAFLSSMLSAEVLVLLTVVLTVILRPAGFAAIALFIALWSVSPFVAYWISSRQPAEQTPANTADVRFARLIARRTWRFFETFVGAQDNWLPPDNFQEDPPTIAHRASPTDIGLLLLATVSAHDFGYVSSLEFTERQELTFASLAKLAKFRGHFFNWYDTKTLQPLPRQYISTVDSGNLAGHLIALKQACSELPHTPMLDDRVIDGLTDTISAAAAEVEKLGKSRRRSEPAIFSQLQQTSSECQKLVTDFDGDSLNSWLILFEGLLQKVSETEDILNTLAQYEAEEDLKDLRWWIEALRHQIGSYNRQVRALTPWTGSLPLSRMQRIIAEYGQETTDHFAALIGLLSRLPTPAELPRVCEDGLVQLAALRSSISLTDPADSDEWKTSIDHLTVAIEAGAKFAQAWLSRLEQIAQSAQQLVAMMDFRFLLDPERQVFTVGYDISEGRADNAYHDLLASEARLASFVAVAKGDVPMEHWFRMGRQLTSVHGVKGLVSWSGTMYEYLMPLLVMRNYSNTLLGQTYRAVVSRQVEYGRERDVPWGISEAAYNVRDVSLIYQYGAFGVPGLGLKRGLMEDLVVAPYATMLAAMVDRPAAIKNLDRLAHEGALGAFGYYESIDYTGERIPQGETRVLIRSYMTHHQGVTLVALGNALFGRRMANRFHADPMVQATELLLQERIPVDVPPVHPHLDEISVALVDQKIPGMATRVYHDVDTETPRTHLLSNGTYSVMLTAAGGGYSNCGPNAVTRWREDATRDNWGSFIYLRDVRSGTVWSAGYQPINKQPQSYEVIFSENKADFWRSDSGITTHMEIVVSAEDNAEVRRVSLINNSTRTREIELTSYAEVVLNTPLADALHPAHSNLFIEMEVVNAGTAILAHRRRRSSDDEPLWGIHVAVVEGDRIGEMQYETDRARFLGRGQTPAEPIFVVEDRPQSNLTGAVLDPIFSLRRRVRILPRETVRCTFSTIVARSREQAMILADKYHDPNTFEREQRLAWTKAQVEMTHLNVSADDAQLFQRLAAHLIYSNSSLRPRPHVLALNTRAQSSLWAYGISGDLPILLVRISQAADLPIVRKIVRGHEYLHYKGLEFDLVILNDNQSTDAQPLQKELVTMIHTSGLGSLQDKSGGLFLRPTDEMPESDRILLHSVARAIIVTERGPLDDQLERLPVKEPLPATFIPRIPPRTYPEPTLASPELTFFNGMGGFHQGGREYYILLSGGQWTPAPWSNIIANENQFGFQVTESGAGYTWSLNSRENRLTPWSNDPVSDPPGEIVYFRDEDTGTLWSATPLPIREAEPYIVRHGQGYSVFEHTSHGISQELLLFVPLDSPVKISQVRLRNRTDRKRRVTVTHYSELVLGIARTSSAPYVITEINEAQATIFANNPFNNEFAGRVAFAATNERLSSATCDRKEFIGRNGTLTRPAALRRVTLDGRDGAGLDPCAALQTTIELAPHEGRELTFILGEAASQEEAESLVTKFTDPTNVNNSFEGMLTHWDTLLGAIEVRTPDAAMDTMLNRWLLYQTLACRIWARSAFYQSAGAFGFRDQLHDVMALVYSSPAIARQQILLAGAHQFKEGDVQHWWHPPSGRGIRTRCSDDLLWLPFVATFYANVTGDAAVFDEVVPFLEQSLLKPDQQEAYMLPAVSDESASIYEHCVRALDRSLAVGPHGLPLMGGGDWNDSMNRVGHQGKGESVWLGWFLYKTLEAFAPCCDARGDPTRGDGYRNHLEKLRKALAESGWDGDWYRRAYFDDGTPLGSVQNDECRIDSIAQSWSVISGAAETYRQQRAMAAVEEYLIRRGDGLVILFTPPFDKSKLDPGYIKGYLPGVRENGGQYTHAALWTLIAFAILGDGERAGELFSLLNPINHASTLAGLHKYKVEPYVAATDVYAVPSHLGRGGWTWYTGSAGLMYRAGLESILGFKLQGESLRIDPCVPRWWRDFEITYRRGAATYRIKVENPTAVSGGIATVELDGLRQPTDNVLLNDDGNTHIVRIVLGEPVPFEAVIPLPPVEPSIPLEPLIDQFLNGLRVNSIREMADTATRLDVMSGFDGLPEELRSAFQSFHWAAQHAERIPIMRLPSVKIETLDQALAEIDKLDQRTKFMRGQFTPRIREEAVEWREVLLTTRKSVQAETPTYVTNPFVFGPPINSINSPEGKAFTGREDIIEKIETDILGAKQPPTLLLYGPRRMGKTSILNQLSRLLGPNYSTAIVDFQSFDNIESLDTLLQNISEAVCQSMQRQGFKIEALPKDVGGKPFAALRQWLRSAENAMVAHNKDARILLCFDEYEKLQDAAELKWKYPFLDTLRSIIQSQPRVIVMFTGVKTFQELGSDWVQRFNSAKYIRVSFLKLEDVRLLLEEPAPEFNNTYEPGTIEAIFAATQGQPFLTQAVASELYNLVRQQKRLTATLADVDEAIESAMTNGGVYFDNVWDDVREGGQAILIAKVTGAAVPDFPLEMNLLKANDVLDSRGMFAVPMVERWLRKKLEIDSN